MSKSKEWILKKESEIRCEVLDTELLTLKLTNGSAEIFGIEMAPNKDYIFKDQNVAVFTWYGCVIESTGLDRANAIYLADNTPMISYANTHVQLQAKRDVALNNAERGPRVMVVGPSDHGKSSVAQILAAYAARLDRTPVFVDLDVGQSSLSMPGCITATPLNKTNLNVESGFCNCMPLVYFHGHYSPKDSPELYCSLVSQLAETVNRRMENDLDCSASGMIVNTSGWVEGAGFDCLVHCIKALQIDVVLVMSHDRLHSSLVAAFDGFTGSSAVTVVKLPKSGGVVTRDSAVRKRLRKTSSREYFYGRLAASASPTSTAVYSPERRENVPISSFVFLRVGGVQLTQGMRIIGDSSHQDSACKLVRIVPTADLTFAIVAVLNTDGIDTAASGKTGVGSEANQDLLRANAAGFVSIVHMDIENGFMTLLCPCGGALPSNYLLVGSVKWVE